MVSEVIRVSSCWPFVGHFPIGLTFQTQKLHPHHFDVCVLTKGLCGPLLWLGVIFADLNMFSFLPYGYLSEKDFNKS